MPTVLVHGELRIAFASNDCPEPPHVHAIVGRGQAKFWLEPMTRLDKNHGLTRNQLRTARILIDERHGECLAAWWRHCPPIDV
jgi:Domain of unknown function (DUF4160)